MNEQQQKDLGWFLKQYINAEDYCRPYFDRAKRYYRLYRFGSAVSKDDWPYINKVSTRDILAFVEDSTATMIQSLLGQYPWYSVLMRQENVLQKQYGIDAVAIGKQIEKVLNYQVSHEDAEFLDEMVDFLKEGMIFGNSYMGVYPKFQAGQYMGPLFKTVGYWDCLPIPGGRRITKSKGVFIREYLFPEDILAMQEKEGMFKDQDIKGALASSTATEQWHKNLLESLGISGYESKDGDVEVLHYFSGGQLVDILNRKYILRDSRQAQEKPFPYDQPIVQYKFMPVPLEFFGMGIPEVLEVLQEDKNLIRSARRDNIDLVINKIVLARAGADINYDLLKYYAGAIWPLESLNDLEPLKQEDVTQSAYMEEDKVKADMENALSMFGYSRGMTPTHEERPTTVIKLQQAAMNRLDLSVKLAEFTVLQNIATRVVLLTRRYMPKEVYEAIIGEQDAGFYSLPEEEIRKFYMFKPMGSTITHIKEIRQQQIQFMMGLLANVSQVSKAGVQPFDINFYEAAKTSLDSMDIPNIEKILIPVDPIQVQMQQQQQTGMQQEMINRQMQMQQMEQDKQRQHEMALALVKQMQPKDKEGMKKVKYGG